MQSAQGSVLDGELLFGAAGPTGEHAPLRRISLRQEIADVLSDDLVTGRLPAGTSLTVNETAQRFGVSATPVREALIQLAAHGLLLGGHHRGFQVCSFTWTDFSEIVESRRLLGVPLIGRVARTAPDEAMPTLRLLGDRLDGARWNGDVSDVALLDRRFFGELGRWSGNRRLSDVLAVMRVQGWMYIVPYLRDAAETSSGWGRYRELADRVALRDAEGAMELMRDYTSSGRRIARELTDAG
ncbi:GntR family transcriptional regulator [Embleya sp. NBC_00896]|uniref:GntR family transcriptional regulator n=1 Tax=Embleya sp. NBC_00896 TaxID=2975961 RepID=UPI00386547ED|nr:GntR family transcriptional regulator [Embleya sp. NBC_00896]